MKLRRLHIQGFRSIRSITFEVDDFLCFIGQNNHGKSNIFQALDLFFSSTIRGIIPDIFFRSPNETAREIIIEASFEDLSQAEMEKLHPWTVNEVLTVSKKYWIEDGKPQVSYEALMKIPNDEWLQENFESYNERDVVSKLPIAQFLPESGRITKPVYKEAIQKYVETYPNNIEYIEERRLNPAGYKQVLDGYLPEFYLVPAVRDVTEETKTSGATLLSRLLNVIISRIARQNPAFQRLEDTVQEIRTLIEGKTPEEKLAEIRELEERLKQELGPWDVGLSIGVEAPDIERVFQLGTSITLNDGIPTGVDEKGHGLQRYLIFALMRVWAAEARRAQTEENMEIRERSHIFAFEEPELFLHPQMCRATYEALKQISRTDQSLVCTHSPHFIDMEDYRSIVMVRKTNLEIGTQVQRVLEELFHDEKKRRFNMVRFFNPDRNELFFARKVILVEGPTEKSTLPLIARHIGCFDHRVSIIDCGSKFNLTLYMEVLNAFRIPYLVIHDEDQIDPELKPGGAKYDPDKFREAKQTFEESQRIKDTADYTIGAVRQIPGEFENLLGISRAQADKLGKPFAAVEKYAQEGIEISADVKELVRTVYE
jgi:putative ATP-dependent endonuclease of OLD family